MKEEIGADRNLVASEHGKALGGLIRQTRKREGLSIRALSSITGLTPAFISNVELGKALPSLVSLQLIADGLGVPLRYFFAGIDDVRIVRRSDRRIIREPPSRAEFQALTDESAPIRILCCCLAPGCSTRPEPRAHTGYECAWVLEGDVLARIGGRTITLKEGDTVSYGADNPHSFANIGDAEATIVWFSVFD